jgi:hypothetical protein
VPKCENHRPPQASPELPPGSSISNKRWARFIGFGTTALAALSMVPASAAAQTTVYESEDLSVDVGFDAAAVVFVQDDPWFGEAEANIGVDTDGWAEFAVEPQLYVTAPNFVGGELSAGISFVSTKTLGESADGLAVGFDDPSATTLEKLYLGWRGDIGQGTVLDLKAGDFDYQIGTGFLIKDGGRDGGDRGAFYLGARSASRSSALARVSNGGFTFEAFWLGNNPGRSGVRAHVGGANLEYSLSDRTSLGLTYIEVGHFDDPVAAGTAEELKTYDVRASVGFTDQLTLSAEYARQSGADFYDGVGWYIQGDYVFENVSLNPTLTYRYAVVSGDDPATVQNEEFIPLAYGFTDYGQWYQGEITGNWIFANSNQKTHMVKAAAALSDDLSLTGSWINFTLDEPAQLGVLDDDFGNEFNLFLDWQATDELFFSVAGAVMVPSNGAKQFTGGSSTWSHVMLYASASF